MSDSVAGRISSMSARFRSTNFVASSGSVTIVTDVGDSLTIRPVSTLPSAVCTMLALYWSETTLLGSQIASTRSLTWKRPPACVRSGPVEPPSLP